MKAPAVRALLAFLQAHAGDGVLDAAAMAQMNGVLVPAALVAWPGLQQVLESEVKRWDERSGSSGAVFPWTAARGFVDALSREHVCALIQLLMLQVGPD